MLNVRIKLCSPYEYLKLFEIFYEVNVVEWGVQVSRELLWEEFQEELHEEESYIITDGEQCFGFMSVHLADAFIHHLYIQKSFRGKGFGKRLLDYACQKLKLPLRLKCLKSNEKALLFYHKQGWGVVAEGESMQGGFYLLEFNGKNIFENSSKAFLINERLLKDTIYIGKMRLSHVLLMNQSEIPWFILVPEVFKKEMHELEGETQILLWQEIGNFSKFVKNILIVDKMNIGAIGNIVSQLHVHVIGRKQNDSCWPNVVWGQMKGKPYTKEEIFRLKDLVKSSLGQSIIVY